MARREVIDCDRCKEKAVASPVVVQGCVGWSPCPAGGAAERDLDRIDLCHKCAATLLNAAVGDLDEDAAKRWFEKARRKP